MTEKTNTSRLRPGLRIVLLGSLALNLLVVGLVAGALVRGGPFRDGPPHGREPVTPYTSAFAEDQRRDLRRALGRALRRDHDKAPAADLSESYQRALQLLRSDPFNAAAMAEILRRQAELTDKRRRTGEGILADYLAGLSPEERRAYAERLEEEVERFERRRHRPGKRD